MIRWGLFLVLAAGAAGYAFWVYLRLDLGVAGSRWMALFRALALVTVLALLFDLRVPTGEGGGASGRWALLDASLSMAAPAADGGTAWEAARRRAGDLAADGWNVVTFGGDPPAALPSDPSPTEIGSLLVPALRRAAEGGAREVVVLSDQRFEDAVAIRSALETLPLGVSFEGFGAEGPNGGIARLEVPDFARPGEPVTARLEVHGGAPGDTLEVDVFAEEERVANLRVPAPAPGLRSAIDVEIPPPGGEGRVRYTAAVTVEGDRFSDDDRAVDYAAVGREEGALVLVSLTPDWEPRYLLPVLGEVTGLPTVGYLRVGGDRFVEAGRAVDRSGPVDSATVRRAVSDAALVVVHGLGGDVDAWTARLVSMSGRKIVLARDASGAALGGLDVGPPSSGEWYVSADVPASPIAGALTGAPLQGLPPLSDVMVATDPASSVPLLVQLRGAGTPEPAVHLVDRGGGRSAVVVSSGFWRWAARDVGREAYRRVWSGVAGWLLADRTAPTAEPRPIDWVVARGEPVTWSLPPRDEGVRLVVEEADSVVVDTVFAATGVVGSGVLPPGSYAYRVEAPGGDTLGSGRFDVSRTTAEMLPLPTAPAAPARVAARASGGAGGGRPVRTLPWPYLLVIALLCGEWIGRRRTGLR